MCIYHCLKVVAICLNASHQKYLQEANDYFQGIVSHLSADSIESSEYYPFMRQSIHSICSPQPPLPWTRGT